MNSDALILPQTQNLVLKQSGLSERLAQLFQHLSESSQARQSFVDSPEELLTEHLGIDSLHLPVSVFPIGFFIDSSIPAIQLFPFRIV